MTSAVISWYAPPPALPSFFGSAWRRCLSIFLLCLASYTSAADLGVRQPRLQENDENYSLSADFDIVFNARLEEAVSHGIVLYFLLEFELTQPRWYWFDGKIVQKERTYQLSYHALTRQYRVSTGGLHQNFLSLDDALRTLSRLRGWPVINKSELKIGQTYQAAMRLRLDLSQLPKTFQINALANKDWNLSSEWLRWNFSPNEASAPTTPPSELNPPPSLPSTTNGSTNATDHGDGK